MTLIYSDPWFKISTKTLPIIVTTLFLVNLGHRAYRVPNIDCTILEENDSGRETPMVNLPSFPGDTFEMNESKEIQELPVPSHNLQVLPYKSPAKIAADNICFNNGTFLVIKGYPVSMQTRLMFPKVPYYNEAEDKLIHLPYYQATWQEVLIWCLSAYFINLIWKYCFAMQKIRTMLVVVEPFPNVDTDFHARARVFIENLNHGSYIGERVNPEEAATSPRNEYCGQAFLKYFRPCLSNDTFGIVFFFFKIVAAFIPLFLYAYLHDILGSEFTGYGFKVLVYVIGDSDDVWPNPMDVLFPTAALCGWDLKNFEQIGPNTTVCKLHLNNLVRSVFFVLWWTLAVSAFLVFAHCTKIGLMFFSPNMRDGQYRKHVYKACKEIVEAAAEYYEEGEDGQMETKRHKREDVVQVNLDFGAWLVLEFIKKNCSPMEFDQFLRQLSAIPNPAIYIRHHEELVSSNERVAIEEGYIEMNTLRMSGN